MTLWALSGLLNGLAATGLTILVYSRDPHDSRHRTFGYFGLAVAIWSFAYFGWQLAETREVAFFLARIFMMGAIFIPVTYLHHILVLLHRVGRHKTILRVSYVLAVLFLIGSMTPAFIADLQPALSFPFWPRAGWLFHPFLVWWTLLAIFPIYLLSVACKREIGSKRTQYLYLLLGTIIGYSGGATNFPLWYDIPLQPFGTIFTTIYVALVAYTLLRHRLMDFSLALEKGVTYLLLMVLVALPVYPLLLLMQKIFWNQINLQFSFLLLALFLLTIIGAYKMKIGTEGVISRALFRERHEMHRTLTNFSKALVTILDVSTLTQEIVRTLGRTMGANTVVLYLLNQQQGNYRLAAEFGQASRNTPITQTLARENLLPQYLQKTKVGFMVHDLESDPNQETAQLLVLLRESFDGEVMLPLINKTRLVGFCCLGPRMGSDSYSEQDLAMLMTLAQEAALALDNSLLYEELKDSQAQAHRADRLRSLESMAGGLAHEIRPPLGSIKAFVTQVPQRIQDPEVVSKLSEEVALDVAKIERLIKEVLDYARQTKTEFRQEDLNEIVDSCLCFIEAIPTSKPVMIEKTLSPVIPPLWIDRQQIKQVVLNIFMSSLDMMGAVGGTITVVTQPRMKSEQELWAELEITLARGGLPLSDLQDGEGVLFAREATTDKNVERSMRNEGFGLSIANQIIQEHQGFIDVKPGVGADISITVLLPAKSRTSRAS
ncbi:ATP-binding protein [Candidatus Nitronereus thalassa]|uniref:histidine kinase n=1 Tax=Candidatus Nitronereus thalassa TaxID=3020898 RepID=A0ABU3K410_9BACT|nr:GAF domain-containing protein [Candidatus Nitronereus thalassa]MDT7041142.1 GAF domain-containing protein [Candidatus Nitronereus thalassa]